MNPNNSSPDVGNDVEMPDLPIQSMRRYISMPNVKMIGENGRPQAFVAVNDDDTIRVGIMIEDGKAVEYTLHLHGLLRAALHAEYDRGTLDHIEGVADRRG